MTGPGEDRLRQVVRRRKTAKATRQPSALDIFNTLCQRFDVEELQMLCFVLKMNYDALSGDNKRAKIRALIDFYQRREELDTLIETIRTQRPDVCL